MKPLFLPIAFLLAAVAIGAEAQQRQDSDGFEIVRQGSGFVRLDKTTGAMSFCRVVTGNLVCRPGVEEREAYLEALDRLGDQLEDVEVRLSKIERERPRNRGDVAAPSTDDDALPQAGEGVRQDGLDLGRRLDKVASLAQQAIHRFFEVVHEYRHELETRGD